ncbi:MAG: M20/M25/M40 family metallo-hydrolase [Nannocystaceae bacterium]
MSADPVVQRIIKLSRSDSRVQQHLRYLTKTIGPRLSSSHNLIRAELWARDQFARWGLESGLEEWGEFAVGFDRGPSSGSMHKDSQPSGTGAIALEFTTDAWTPGVPGPTRGRAVLAPTTLRDARARMKANTNTFRDAWLVSVRHTHRNEHDHAHERQRGGSASETPERLEEFLRTAGSLGYVRADRDTRGELVHTEGHATTSWTNLPKDVRVNLRSDQHSDLLRSLEAGMAVELEFSIDNRFFLGPVKQHNVIADLVGTERPEELVIVGGHLDSWDGAQGAVDNATGVATTMEAARLLVASGAKPKRTIRFILWSGEEQGLLGSRAYVDQNPDILEKISAVFVHDGGTNFISGLSVTPEMLPQMQHVFFPVTKLDPERMPFQLYVTEVLRGGGSDHAPFIDAGVPGFFWGQSGESVYRCMHHTQHDNFAAAVPEYQRHSSVVVAIAAWNIANLPDLIDRTDSLPIRRGQIGATLEGLTVIDVQRDGPAERSGWRVGDMIAEINGEGMENHRDLRRVLRKESPPTRVTLRRGKRTLRTVLDDSDDNLDPARERRIHRRLRRFGPDIFAGPQPSPDSLFGDPEASCRPGAGAP